MGLAAAGILYFGFLLFLMASAPDGCLPGMGWGRRRRQPQQPTLASPHDPLLQQRQGGAGGAPGGGAAAVAGEQPRVDAEGAVINVVAGCVDLEVPLLGPQPQRQAGRAGAPESGLRAPLLQEAPSGGR